MKKLLFLSAACWLAACEGPIFGSKKAPTFVIESPYADEQVNDMMTPDVYAPVSIHISEPTRLRRISYAVFCLKKKKKKKNKKKKKKNTHK